MPQLPSVSELMMSTSSSPLHNSSSIGNPPSSSNTNTLPSFQNKDANSSTRNTSIVTTPTESSHNNANPGHFPPIKHISPPSTIPRIASATSISSSINNSLIGRKNSIAAINELPFLHTSNNHSNKPLPLRRLTEPSISMPHSQPSHHSSLQPDYFSYHSRQHRNTSISSSIDPLTRQSSASQLPVNIKSDTPHQHQDADKTNSPSRKLSDENRGPAPAALNLPPHSASVPGPSSTSAPASTFTPSHPQFEAGYGGSQAPFTLSSGEPSPSTHYQTGQGQATQSSPANQPSASHFSSQPPSNGFSAPLPPHTPQGPQPPAAPQAQGPPPPGVYYSAYPIYQDYPYGMPPQPGAPLSVPPPPPPHLQHPSMYMHQQYQPHPQATAQPPQQHYQQYPPPHQAYAIGPPPPMSSYEANNALLNKRRIIKRRTRTGCLTCRKRRIKCDERKPHCYNCERSKKLCLGYENLSNKYGPSNLNPKKREADALHEHGHDHSDHDHDRDSVSPHHDDDSMNVDPKERRKMSVYDMIG